MSIWCACIHKDSSPSLLGHSFILIIHSLKLIVPEQMVHSHEPLESGKCLGEGSALTHASFLWETLHTCMNTLCSSILQQDIINPYSPRGPWVWHSVRWSLRPWVVIAAIPINDWSSPLRVKTDGRSGLLFQISFQPSVCSELIERNCPDHSLISLNISTWLLICSELTRRRMRCPLWDDPMTSARVWNKWIRFLNLEQFGVK